MVIWVGEEMEMSLERQIKPRWEEGEVKTESLTLVCSGIEDCDWMRSLEGH